MASLSVAAKTRSMGLNFRLQSNSGWPSPARPEPASWASLLFALLFASQVPGSQMRFLCPTLRAAQRLEAPGPSAKRARVAQRSLATLRCPEVAEPALFEAGYRDRRVESASNTVHVRRSDKRW